MPPKSKASSSMHATFADLAAELAESKAHISKNRAAGVRPTKQKAIKKVDAMLRSNKGVDARKVRDIEAEVKDRREYEHARQKLEEKSKMYEQLRKGRTGGLSDAQLDELLFDTGDHYESDSDDLDESLTVPVPAIHDLDDDSFIEYKDEYGRDRRGKKSEVPPNLWPEHMRGGGGENDDDDDQGIELRHEDAMHNFATYEPDVARQEQIKKFLEEQKEGPLDKHYDASNENRAKGAGFYAFSQDEEERRKQMEELLNTRKETMEVRKDTGAMDLKPGEAQGLKAEGPGGIVHTAAMAKRKKELEERRNMIQMKRRKVTGDVAESSSTQSSPASSSRPAAQPSALSSSSGSAPDRGYTGDPYTTLEAAPSDPFAALEATSIQADPFAAVQQKSTRPPRSRWDKRPTPDVDSFLADVEKDLVSGKRRV